VDTNISLVVTSEFWSAVHCINNLKSIGLFGQLWSYDHDPHMPQSLSEATNSFGLPIFGWPLVLFCRADTARTPPADWPGLDLANTSYELVPGDDQDFTRMFCRCKVHGFYYNRDSGVVSWPWFSRVRRSGNTTELGFTVPTSKTNRLEASTDLLNWTVLVNYVGTNGSFWFYDTNSASRRFYRIRGY